MTAEKKISRLASDNPSNIAWRTEQAYVDGAIEGIERHPVFAAFVDQMDTDGIPIEEQIKRIIEFDLKDTVTAAE